APKTFISYSLSSPSRTTCATDSPSWSQNTAPRAPGTRSSSAVRTRGKDTTSACTHTVRVVASGLCPRRRVAVGQARGGRARRHLRRPFPGAVRVHVPRLVGGEGHHLARRAGHRDERRRAHRH